LVGAAIASMIARFIYNLISWGFVYYKFQMQPFTWNYFTLIGIGLISFLLASIVPNFDWLLLDITIKSSAFLLLFVVMLYFSGFSEDVNQTLDKILDFVRNKK
jgi:hypothetical protein